MGRDCDRSPPTPYFGTGQDTTLPSPEEITISPEENIILPKENEPPFTFFDGVCEIDDKRGVEDRGICPICNKSVLTTDLRVKEEISGEYYHKQCYEDRGVSNTSCLHRLL